MAKRFDQTASGPSQRQQRVGELVRHALAEVLARGDLQDEVLSSYSVTIPEVRMSPDLRLATAYVMPLGGQDEGTVLNALVRNRKILRQEVARRVNLKFAPDLRFLRDASFDEAARIDALLRSEKVRRDIGADPSDETDEHGETATDASSGPDTEPRDRDGRSNDSDKDEVV
ncbi:30S ribosome-binding factor RbfA [Microvirga massiliensis]|uniref:30S ribosome-binding factor RbfA n=1 Tax=Microvirga massiliensis TaxID=1033741 RepID=UPI0009E259A9|nr:30S ribosome-binding factor RbfA [Microvirga massiliensis]